MEKTESFLKKRKVPLESSQCAPGSAYGTFVVLHSLQTDSKQEGNGSIRSIGNCGPFSQPAEIRRNPNTHNPTRMNPCRKKGFSETSVTSVLH